MSTKACGNSAFCTSTVCRMLRIKCQSSIFPAFVVLLLLSIKSYMYLFLPTNKAGSFQHNSIATQQMDNDVILLDLWTLGCLSYAYPI